MSDNQLSVPVWSGYFADPQVVRTSEGTYVAYGSGPPASEAPFEDRVFRALSSDDLTTWEDEGFVLDRLPTEFGDEYWAPEVCFREEAWWMYYSVGRGIDGHHLRVARADKPLGPFVDVGVVLTPDESFAIDAHPFCDPSGNWYMFYARDVLLHDRVGTHIAVAQMPTPTSLTNVRSALSPNADWQIYERDRAMYGETFDWHTIEGPSVVFRSGKYWMTYSGGAWTGSGYGVSWAWAHHPMGPWISAPEDSPKLLETTPELIGPGHNSLIRDSNENDYIIFHSWNRERTKRQMQLRLIDFGSEAPRLT